jgi:hypothetical protein
VGMEDGYKFKEDDIQKIILQLLIDLFSFQQASISVIIEKLNVDEAEKDNIMNDINSLLPSLKEELLQNLYVSFGKTPDV